MYLENWNADSTTGILDYWFGKNSLGLKKEQINYWNMDNEPEIWSGTHDDVVEGCVFRDIGGNGIQLGKFSDEGIETHIPYNPSDAREVCQRERIANNLVTDCANED